MMNKSLITRETGFLPGLLLAWLIFSHAPIASAQASAQINVNVNGANDNVAFMGISANDDHSIVVPVVEINSPSPISIGVPVDAKTTVETPDSDSSVASPSDFSLLSNQQVQFPYEETPGWAKLIEFGPKILTKPDEPLAKLFGHVFHLEHDHTSTDLAEHAIGLQPIPQRPNLILE